MMVARAKKIKLDVEYEDPEYRNFGGDITVSLHAVNTIETSEYSISCPISIIYTDETKQMQIVGDKVPMHLEWFTQLAGCQLHYLIRLKEAWE